MVRLLKRQDLELYFRIHTRQLRLFPLCLRLEMLSLYRTQAGMVSAIWRCIPDRDGFRITDSVTSGLVQRTGSNALAMLFIG